MSETQAPSPSCEPAWKSQKNIPVRNLWVLLVYASELMEFKECLDLNVDEKAELPDILARLLTVVVERRLRRNLSQSFQPKSTVLSRVRGRIDWLTTVSGCYLEQGRIWCRFEELTHDTTRNRFVRAALEAMGPVVKDKQIANQCFKLARHLEAKGVSAHKPSRFELAKDQIARHDADDRLMMAVAQIALNHILPAETEGLTKLTRLNRDEVLLRSIFERAVAGFYHHELQNHAGWCVRSQKMLDWQKDSESSEIKNLLPKMVADIILEQDKQRRIVIDTKFTEIITNSKFDKKRFNSQHIYQIYAYLRSQENNSSLLDNASGILLYPSIGCEYNEMVTIQGHEVRFATVNLSSPGDGIRQRLLKLIGLEK